MTLPAHMTEPDLLAWAEENPRAASRLLARNDCEFFINSFGAAIDFRRGTEFEFRERPIQAAFRELILKERLVAGLKARGVGWTWELAHIVLWEAWSKAPYQVIYFAQREDNAKAFIARVRFIYRKLPSWLGFPRVVGQESSTSLILQNAEGLKSEILAFPSLPSTIQSWHPTRIIADEWGEIAWSVLPACLPAVGPEGYFVGLGTAEGLLTEHARVYLSCKHGNPSAYAHEGMQFHTIFAPWFANPDTPQRPSAGTQKDTERMYPADDEEAFALTFPGQAVYPEFRAHLHVSPTPLTAIPELPIFRAWDWGSTPSCVWWQVKWNGQVRVLSELMELVPGVERFGQLVIDHGLARWPGYSYIDYGDASGNDKRDSDGKSCFQILREKHGIVVKKGLQQWTPRREAVARRLSALVDGEPALIVDPSCRLLVQGFTGGYHFPERGDEEDYRAFEEERARERARKGWGA